MVETRFGTTYICDVPFEVAKLDFVRFPDGSVTPIAYAVSGEPFRWDAEKKQWLPLSPLVWS